MKKKYRLFFLVLLTSSFSNLLQAQQESGQSSADSLQRIAMRDSLNVSDTVITQVFGIRSNFLLQSAQINADSLMNEQQKSAAMQSLIAQTNNNIKNLLGEVIYEHYKQMIITRRRITDRPGGTIVQPLASQNDH